MQVNFMCALLECASGLLQTAYNAASTAACDLLRGFHWCTGRTRIPQPRARPELELEPSASDDDQFYSCST